MLNGVKGFINRNGSNITPKAYANGFLNAFNMEPSIFAKVLANAFALCSNVTGTNCTTLDLDVLKTPHRIEHDGSMSRDDAEMLFSANADNNDFNQTIWDSTLAIMGNASHIDTQLANTVRLRRFEEAEVADMPGWFIENDSTTLVEHAFVLTSQ